MSGDEKAQTPQQLAPEPSHQPIFNLPPAVTAMAGLFVAIQAASSLVLNDSGREAVITWFAFVPFRFTHPELIEGGLLPVLWTSFTHAFLHAGWEHVLLNTAWFVIFGSVLERRYGAVKLIGLFLVGAIVGAAAFTVTTWGQVAFLVGASGGVAALTGAAIRFMFQPIQFAIHPETGERVILGRRLATLGEVWAHPTARFFTLVWIVLNAAVPLVPVLTGQSMGGGIAWQAHLGGFLVGFLGVPLLEKRQK
jgi:membrane associated rhomboid family serine protease